MIPRDLRDLSVEFFSSILACPVASFTVESAVPFQGNTSVIHSVLVHFAAPLTFPPRRLFLKFALPTGEGEGSALKNVSFSRQSFIDAGVYRKEVAFYRYAKEGAGGGLAGLVPSVLYAEIEPAGAVDHFLLVLGEAGRPLNQLEGCAIDTSRAVMSQAARLHAHFLVNPPETHLPAECLAPTHHIVCQIVYGPGQHADKTPSQVLEHCSRLFEAKFEDFSHVAGAMAKKAGFDFSESLKLIRARFTDNSIISDLRIAFNYSFLSPSFRTLIHGDFRLDNMLLDSDESHETVKFIDFQAIHYGNPSYDLAQFIIQCHNDSHMIFNDLLTIYFNTLCEHAPALAASNHLGTLEDLVVSVRAAAVFQVLLLSFHLAPLKSSVDLETGLLPPSMDRFMDLLVLITKRGLLSYLSL